jgi:PKD repeat protein
VTNGIAPLRVRFAANASDPDGSIRDVQWTFDDGTFATNANPQKIFATPGTYHAHVTVMDNSGNTTRGSVTVTVGTPGVVLLSPAYSNGQFQCNVSGPSNRNYLVEASSDLSAWRPIKTNPGPFTFIDPRASNSPARFYRAFSSP